VIGVAVVGPGFWADAMHLPAFREIDGAEVRAVVGRDPDRTRAVAERHGIPLAITDYARALADPAIDVVDILAPNYLHAELAIAAAEAGKHVICIKPLARDLAEADRMLAAAAAAGTRLLYAENVPFIPAVQQARRIVDSGEIGEVYRVKACEGISAPHAAWHYRPELVGGGVTIDMAVHSVEFCRYMADSPVRTVYAETGSFVHGERTPAEDTAVITLRFDSGAIGQCEDSWGLTGAMDSRFEVFGSEGRILIDNLHRQPLQVVGTTGGWTYPLPIPGAIADGHVAMLAHFVACLRDGTPAASEGAAGRAALAVVEAAVRSTGSGRREGVARPAAEVAG
jgi:predicted dehydrogenase